MTASTVEVAFTPSVKAVQERRGSRRSCARLDENGGWNNTVTPDLAAFIAQRDSLFCATASAARSAVRSASRRSARIPARPR
jgi:cob(I)alamin adenosyltransferase